MNIKLVIFVFHVGLSVARFQRYQIFTKN